jgi:hypothetical protein
MSPSLPIAETMILIKNMVSDQNASTKELLVFRRWTDFAHLWLYRFAHHHATLWTGK